MQYVGGDVFSGIATVGQASGSNYTCSDWSLPSGTAMFGDAASSNDPR